MEIIDNYPWYNGRAYVAAKKQKELVKQIHESKHGGHFGVTRSVSKVCQHYDWLNLRQTVKDVLGDCDICHKTKASRHIPYGMLEPLPVPG
jgi:hypothetical protein